MCGGGKSGTSTQSQTGSVSGSPQAQAMGNAAWGQAFAASQLPFQQYGGQFVAPINQQQTTGIGGINQAAGTYAPYGSAAAGTLGQGLSSGQALTGAGIGLTAQNAQLNPNQINQWMSPYIQNVVQATENQQQQQNQIQQSQLEGSAINSGAFGGDRGGVAAANLAYQQNLANQPVIANLYQQGYGQALGQANTQQQTGLQAGAQLGQLGQQLFGQGLSGAQGYAGLGTTAQTNQLGAAQAQIGAGTLQQQTQQAQDQALYNQFLQQQAYPFQTSQFLTNAASSLAPIYGTQSQSYGTATQPMSFFNRGGRVGYADGGGLSDGIQLALAGDRYTDPNTGETYESRGPWGSGPNHGEYRDYLNSPEGEEEYRRFQSLGDPSLNYSTPEQQQFRSKYLKMYNEEPSRRPRDKDGELLEMWRRLDPGFVNSARGGRIGRAGGGGLSDDALAQLIAAHGQMYASRVPSADQGPYGAGLSGGAGHAQMPILQLPSMVGRQQGATGVGHDIAALNQTADFGKNLAGIYSAGKEAVVGTREKRDAKGNVVAPATGGWNGYGGVWGAKAPTAQGTTGAAATTPSPVNFSIPNPTNAPTLPDGTPITPDYARGGRAGYADGGDLDPTNPGNDTVGQDDYGTGRFTPDPAQRRAGHDASYAANVLRRSPTVAPDPFYANHPYGDLSTRNPYRGRSTLAPEYSGDSFPTRFSGGGRAGYAGGGGLSDEALARIVADTFGRHRAIPTHAAAADSVWWPSRSRGRAAFGLPPETGPVTVAATPPSLPAYAGADDGLPGLSSYMDRQAAPPSVTVRSSAPPADTGGLSAAHVPPQTPAPAPTATPRADWLHRLGMALQAHNVDLPARGAQGELLDNAARGGRIGLAAGGMPYSSGITDPYLPDALTEPDTLKQDLQSARGQSGGMSMPSGQMSSGLGSAIGDISKIAGMAAMFMNSGGRIRKEGGGGLSDAIVDPNAPPPLDPKLAYKHNVGNIISPNGGFNGYATPEEGVAATIRNAQAYQKEFNGGKPLTYQQIADHWAPADNGKDPMLKGNNPKAWASNVATFAGAKPDDPIDLSDPKMASVFAQGVHRQEKGAGTGFDPAVYDRGTQLAYSGKPITPIHGAGQLGGGQASGSTSASLVPLGGASPANGPQQDWWDRKSGGLSGTERAVISLLSGLGGMASSPSRFLGSAVLQGLGAGAGTYGQLAQKGMGLDIAQQQAQNATVGRALEVARYTQSNYKRFIGPNGEPLYRNAATGDVISQGEYQSRLNNVFQSTGLNKFGLGATPYSPTPVNSGTPAPSTVAPATASPAPPAVSPPPSGAMPTPITPPQTAQAAPPSTIVGGHDVSGLQDEYNPQFLANRAQQMKIKADKMIESGVSEQDSQYVHDLMARSQNDLQRADAITKGEITPYTKDLKPDTYWVDQMRKQKAETTAMETEQGMASKQLEDLRSKAQGAYEQKYRLDLMDHQFANMPQQGVMVPGAMATERTNFAKTINTATQALTGKPLFDPGSVAAAEEMGKDTRRLGFELSRTMGREPGFIVQASIGTNPSIDNTPMGYRRIVAGMREAIQYQQDLSQFFDDYFAKHRNLNGAAKEFSDSHPTSAYANRAIMSTVDPRDAEFLRGSTAEDRKSRAAAIDKKYGVGTADLIGKEKP